MRKILLAGAALLLAGCTTTGSLSTSAPPPPSFAYPYVWPGVPPEPYYSQAVWWLDNMEVHYLRTSIDRVEAACGRNRTEYGWFGSACLMTGNATGTQFIVIAEEITDPAVIRLISIHEIAHNREINWSAEHPGMQKPLGHRTACLQAQVQLGLGTSQITALCRFNEGAPLRD